MCQTVFFLIFLPCLYAHTGINFISNLNEMAITIASEITRVLVCDHDPVTTLRLGDTVPRIPRLSVSLIVMVL